MTTRILAAGVAVLLAGAGAAAQDGGGRGAKPVKAG
jgi:hypothetical protein